ncbi:MAG: glycosyltransferase [Acidobacteria bacterium]|nr:glycosyltransferase [Acidobacteriota bacterium]
MKTMHITNSWSETSGGIATFYRGLIEAANRRRHSMSLVVPAARDGQKAFGEFVRIYEVESPKAKFNSGYRTIYPSQFLTSTGRLSRILKLEEPDLVEISDKYTLNYLGPLLRLRLLNDIAFRPVVVGLSFERMDVNFQTYISAGAIGRAFCAWYMRHIYFPFFDHHIAISDQTAFELQAASKGHEITRAVFQLPLGVDCRLFSPRYRSKIEHVRLLHRAGAADGAVLLLYVGRLAPEKNLSLLLDTMKHLPSGDQEYHLIVAGDGISRDSFLIRAIELLGRRLSWLGHISNREELARLYANSDFFIHPNPQEPFGIAPLEAMASGLPVVAPDSGGLKAYANSSNACLTDATGQAFASMIQTLVADASKRQIVIEAALRTAHEFSLETTTDRYLDLYENLHRIIKKELPLEAAKPAFLSQPPSRGRAKVLKLAADSAAFAYPALAGIYGLHQKVKESGNSEAKGQVFG